MAQSSALRTVINLNSAKATLEKKLAALPCWMRKSTEKYNNQKEVESLIRKRENDQKMDLLVNSILESF